MSKVLSISIAGYNVEKTIEQCLDSFLSSKYLNELELLVINDGSHDKTVDIVNEYVKKYPEVIRLINKDNGGHGSTINKSLELAKGEFFKVIDGDDWVNPVELDKLMTCLKTTMADLIIDDYQCVYPDHQERISHRAGYNTNQIYTFDEVFSKKKDHMGAALLAMHESTIRTSRLREVGMEITEHCFYADTDYIYYVGLATRTIEFSNSCTYQYRLGYEGQSVSATGTYKHIEDLMTIEEHLIRLYQEQEKKLDSDIRRQYLFSIIDTRYSLLFSWYIDLIEKGDKDFKLVEFLHRLRSKYPDLICRFSLSRRNRLVAVAPKYMVPLMRKFYKTGTYRFLRACKHAIS